MKSKLFLSKLLVLLVFYFNKPVSSANVSSHLIKKYKTYCDTNLYNCLKLNMLMEIRKMANHKFYPLTDELWLEQTNHTDVAEDSRNYVKHLKINKDNIKLNKVISELSDVFKTHSLFFSVIPGKDLEIYRRVPDGKFSMKLQESRTFGFARRRLMMAIIPIMFKMGVMMSMLVVLMFLTLKSVTIGGILLFIAVTSILSKFKHWISPHHYQSHSVASGEKNIHLHIHTDGTHSQWGSGSHIVSAPQSSFPSSYGSSFPSSHGSSYPISSHGNGYSEGNSWSRQGVSGNDALSITGTLNGQHIHIPLPSGRSPSGFTSPSASYSSSEDYAFLGKSVKR